MMFKVGDKVRWVQKSMAGMTKGKEYEVAKLSSVADGVIHIINDNGRDDSWFIERFELVTPAPTAPDYCCFSCGKKESCVNEFDSITTFGCNLEEEPCSPYARDGDNCGCADLTCWQPINDGGSSGESAEAGRTERDEGRGSGATPDPHLSSYEAEARQRREAERADGHVYSCVHCGQQPVWPEHYCPDCIATQAEHGSILADMPKFLPREQRERHDGRTRDTVQKHINLRDRRKWGW